MTGAVATLRGAIPGLGFGSHALPVIERNLVWFRRFWLVIVSGLVEPYFYLLGIGYGVGTLIGKVNGPDGRPLDYALFVAPGLMAWAAMNGTITETTFNFFGKLKWSKVYDAALATPVGTDDVATGETLSALVRGALYAVGFLVAMLVLGLVASPWGLLAVPASILIGYAFAGAGLAFTTFMRKWQDFDLVFVIILPLFLFSGTFFPLDAYPEAVRPLVALTPLYHGVELLRRLTVGIIGPELIGHAAYLAAMGTIGMAITSRRLAKLLLK
jgi:lipooligosaccharide transport system permease protein